MPTLAKTSSVFFARTESWLYIASRLGILRAGEKCPFLEAEEDDAEAMGKRRYLHDFDGVRRKRDGRGR
jgi:hypothetical protein